MKKFHVSVAMVTYNQAPFIAKAMESVLRQKADFDIEIIVGDDASKDETVAILRRYQERDSRIQLQLRTKNLGASENFREVWKACTGKYIAELEGDDFWIDDQRLQKHVDFMEANLECSVVGSRARIERDGVAVGMLPSDEHMPLVPRQGTGGDFLKLHYIHTSAILFRNVLNGQLPSNFSELLYGDRLLAVLHARHGWIGFIPDVVSVYRQVTQGVLVGLKEIERTRADVSFLEKIEPFLDGKFAEAVGAERAGYRVRLLHLLLAAGRFDEAKSELRKLRQDGKIGIGAKQMLNLNFRVLFPRVFSKTKALKRALLGH